MAGKTARIFAAGIALADWAGLAIQFAATHALVGTAGGALWVLLRFFTVLTNLLLAVVMTVTALRGHWLNAVLLGGTMLSIVLVGIIYMTLLRGMVELSGGALLADAILHMVTPVAAALWWIAFAPKGRLDWRAPLAWSAYPLVYFVYALIRGMADGNYAYPFIDVGTLGFARVAINAVVIAVGFVLAGIGLVALDRRLGARSVKS